MFRKTFHAVVLLAAFAITGCASAPAAVPQSVQQAAYLMVGEYTAAASVVDKYIKLPRCGDAGVKTILCSQATTVATLRVTDACAYAGMKIAENLTRGIVAVVAAPGCTDPTLGALIKQAGSGSLQTALAVARQTIGPLKAIADKIRDFVT